MHTSEYQAKWRNVIRFESQIQQLHVAANTILLACNSSPSWGDYPWITYSWWLSSPWISSWAWLFDFIFKSYSFTILTGRYDSWVHLGDFRPPLCTFINFSTITVELTWRVSVLDILPSILIRLETHLPSNVVSLIRRSRIEYNSDTLLTNSYNN